MELLIAVCRTFKWIYVCTRSERKTLRHQDYRSMNSNKTETTGHIAHVRWYTLQQKGVDDVQDNGDNGGQGLQFSVLTLFIS